MEERGFSIERDVLHRVNRPVGGEMKGRWSAEKQFKYSFEFVSINKRKAFPSSSFSINNTSRWRSQSPLVEHQREEYRFYPKRERERQINEDQRNDSMICYTVPFSIDIVRWWWMISSSFNWTRLKREKTNEVLSLICSSLQCLSMCSLLHRSFIEEEKDLWRCSMDSSPSRVSFESSCHLISINCLRNPCWSIFIHLALRQERKKEEEEEEEKCSSLHLFQLKKKISLWKEKKRSSWMFWFVLRMSLSSMVYTLENEVNRNLLFNSVALLGKMMFMSLFTSRQRMKTNVRERERDSFSFGQRDWRDEWMCVDFGLCKSWRCLILWIERSSSKSVWSWRRTCSTKSFQWFRKSSSICSDWIWIYFIESVNWILSLAFSSFLFVWCLSHICLSKNSTLILFDLVTKRDCFNSSSSTKLSIGISSWFPRHTFHSFSTSLCTLLIHLLLEHFSLIYRIDRRKRIAPLFFCFGFFFEDQRFSFDKVRCCWCVNHSIGNISHLWISFPLNIWRFFVWIGMKEKMFIVLRS